MNTAALNERSIQTHINNATWWKDLVTGESTLATRNRPELMMLVVTELSEANDGVINDKMDDKLPHREMVEVEIADAAIRLHDLLGAENIDITEEHLDDVAAYMVNYEKKLICINETPVTLTEFIQGIVDLVSEAMEGYRKQTKPEMRLQYENGLAKAALACYYVADEWNLDIDAAIVEKQNFNKTREDHQVENRRKEGGKAC